MIGRERIGALIPHGDSMCLIDEVVAWDLAGIHCRTWTHRSPQHPLRRKGRLRALHLVEYAAQAMALHGGLHAGSLGKGAAPGLLASIRDLRIEVQYIDDIDTALDIHARQQLSQAAGWLYSFDIGGNARLLAQGRVMVMTRTPIA